MDCSKPSLVCPQALLPSPPKVYDSNNKPQKNQWRECSLLDCAMSKHSTLVGLRPIFSVKSCV